MFLEMEERFLKSGDCPSLLAMRRKKKLEEEENGERRF